MSQEVSPKPSGNPQVRMRINPETWQAIEAEASKRKVSPGDFVEQLWQQTIPQGFRDIQDQLQILKLQQDKMLALLQDNMLERFMTPSLPSQDSSDVGQLGPECPIRPPDYFDYADHTTWDDPAEPPDWTPPPVKRNPLGRLLGWRR